MITFKGSNMKTLLASALLLCSTATFAHDRHNSCDVEIHGGVKISQQEITFFKDDVNAKIKHQSPLYKIIDDKNLMVNGQLIDLDNSQQKLVSDYAHNIRAMIPAVKQVANEGVDLAIEGVSLAFNELLGDNNDVTNDLVTELANVRTAINQRFDQQKTLYINGDGVGTINGKNFFDQEFENHIGSAIESAVKKAMGSLLIAVGREILFSGGDNNAFEQRMEKFGDEMETKMEFKGAKIERRVNALCTAMNHIDQLEEQLKNSVTELPAFNVLSVEQSKQDEELAE